jgi:hypothetical protein
MSVAITFCDKTEHECTENKRQDSFFLGGEPESFPETIEFETPARFQFVRPLGVNSWFVRFAATAPEQNDNGLVAWNRRTALLIPRTLHRDTRPPVRPGNDKRRRLRIRFRECAGLCYGQSLKSRLIELAAVECAKRLAANCETLQVLRARLELRHLISQPKQSTQSVTSQPSLIDFGQPNV